jgi:hypothetical protein
MTKPNGWNHPSLNLHRNWHVRLSLSLRARQALVLLIPAAMLMWLLSSPWWLLLALIGLLWNPAWLPFRWHEHRTLERVSGAYGEAYVTALGALSAPADAFGFSKRLESQAQNIEKNAELPNLPWLEVLVATVIVSLVWLVPTRVITTGTNGLGANQTALERRQTPEALPESEAGTTGSPVNNSGAQGQTNSSSPGGSGGTAGVGATRPGAGSNAGAPSTESNEDISKEFGQALERGAVRAPSSAEAKEAKQAAERAAKQAADDRNASGGDGGASEASRNSGTANGKGSDSGNGSNPGQPSTQQRDNPGQSNGSPSGQNQPGQNQQAQNQPGQKPNGQGQPSPNNRDNRGPRGKAEPGDDSNFDGMSPTQKDNDPNGNPRSVPGGKGTTGSGKPQSVPEADGAGKLEYLPGETKRNVSRSGALPLPGDSSRTLPAGPNAEPYRRAAESAVLDPRLPPEYQELLKQYYR